MAIMWKNKSSIVRNLEGTSRVDRSKYSERYRTQLYINHYVKRHMLSTNMVALSTGSEILSWALEKQREPKLSLIAGIADTPTKFGSERWHPSRRPSSPG